MLPRPEEWNKTRQRQGGMFTQGLELPALMNLQAGELLPEDLANITRVYARAHLRMWLYRSFEEMFEEFPQLESIRLDHQASALKPFFTPIMKEGSTTKELRQVERALQLQRMALGKTSETFYNVTYAFGGLLNTGRQSDAQSKAMLTRENLMQWKRHSLSELDESLPAFLDEQVLEKAIPTPGAVRRPRM
jgi:hypothetical protein